MLRTLPDLVLGCIVRHLPVSALWALERTSPAFARSLAHEWRRRAARAHLPPTAALEQQRRWLTLLADEPLWIRWPAALPYNALVCPSLRLDILPQTVCAGARSLVYVGSVVADCRFSYFDYVADHTQSSAPVRRIVVYGYRNIALAGSTELGDSTDALALLALFARPRRRIARRFA